jgi:hypothetical protein
MKAFKQSEHRRFTRIPFNARVTLQQGTMVWNTELIDISMKGVLTETPDGWQADAEGTFDLDLILENSSIAIRMEVAIAHQEDGRVGFICEHIDLDSITHLRRLVELNLGDTELLNRELSGLGW